jgi:hypothetical protein
VRSALPPDPLPDVRRDIAALDLVETGPGPVSMDPIEWAEQAARARAYIAKHFERSEWSEQVGLWMERNWLADADEDGRECFVCGDRGAWMADYTHRRGEEAAEAQRCLAESPRRQNEADLYQAFHARRNAGRAAARGDRRAGRMLARAAALVLRARVAFARTRPRARGHRAAHSQPRSGARSSRAALDPSGDPDPAGDALADRDHPKGAR